MGIAGVGDCPSAVKGKLHDILHGLAACCACTAYTDPKWSCECCAPNRHTMEKSELAPVPKAMQQIRNHHPIRFEKRQRVTVRKHSTRREETPCWNYRYEGNHMLNAAQFSTPRSLCCRLVTLRWIANDLRLGVPITPCFPPSYATVMRGRE